MGPFINSRLRVDDTFETDLLRYCFLAIKSRYTAIILVTVQPYVDDCRLWYDLIIMRLRNKRLILTTQSHWTRVVLIN